MERAQEAKHSRRNTRTVLAHNPETIDKFRRMFNKYFRHLNQPLNPGQLRNLLENRFTILGETREVKPIDWNQRHHNRSWNFRLHCFDYVLWSARAFVGGGDEAPMRRCQTLIEWWIKTTDVGVGDGWKPNPTSQRIVNWIYAYTLIAETWDDQVFLGRWRASIYKQLDYLSRHPEYHLRGSSLLKNVKALVIGYLFFDQIEPLKRWEKLLWKQFEMQVLEDGGHYQRSPMRHAQSLADFFECFTLLYEFERLPPSGDILRSLLKMARFLEQITFPDEFFAMFNDTVGTDDILPTQIIASVKKRCDYQPDTTHGLKEFRKTGYYVWRSADSKDQIVINAGPPMGNHLSGPAQCDLLSYELWLDGQLFIIDSGIHGYDRDEYREYSHSTRAHNTVMVNGREQSKIWGQYRLGRRAKLIGSKARYEEKDGTFWFYGEYQRYNRGVLGLFDSSINHQRYITRRRNGEWTIEDIVTRGRMDEAMSFIHLHRNWEVKDVYSEEQNRIQIICCPKMYKEYEVLIETFAEEAEPDLAGDVEVEIVEGQKNPHQGWWFQSFGDPQEAYTICLKYLVKKNDKFGYKIRVIR